MFYLYYTTNNNLLFDISGNPNKYDVTQGIIKKIEITKEEKKQVMSNLNDDNVVYIINDEIVYDVNVTKKAEELREEREVLYKELNPFLLPMYQEIKGFTVEEIEKIKTYYTQLLDLPQNFYDCVDKNTFVYVLTDENDNSENTNNVVYLKKPSFVL